MTDPIDDLARHADAAAALLRVLGHPARLQVLCHLAAAGEVGAGELAARAGLGQSAMSQHLAKLRDEALVETRREGTAIRYRLIDGHAARIVALLYELYCEGQKP